MNKFTLILLLGMSATVASATTITEGPLSYPASGYTQTDWQTVLTFAKFNPSLGILNSVYFELTGNVSGTIFLENIGLSPTDVTAQLAAELHLQRPGGSDIVVAIPSDTRYFTATGFDGFSDFGGTSGVTYSNITASNTQTVTLSGASDLALFTGSGSINLPFEALATSHASGSGNIIYGFTTTAGGTATLVYDYTSTPEPSSMFLLGSALLGIGLIWRKKAVN